MAFMSLKDIDVSYDKKKQILKGLSLDVEKRRAGVFTWSQRLRKNLPLFV